MNSFSGPEFAKASRILRALKRGDILEVPLPKQGKVVGVFEEPARLLQSLQHFHSNSVGLFVVDPPRATTRLKARLWDVDDDGFFVIREVAQDDPDYRFHLAATVLAAVRLMVTALHPCGWIVAFATTDTYMMVRGALEQYLGFDRFRGELVYQTKSGGGNDSKYIVTEHETILAFSMSENARNLRISKEESELTRYSQEDDEGKFKWDTFIRRAARQYYPITCPDDSVLEFDADGNRISWLWSEKTFKKAYAKGDVELRNVGGEWKAYYKDRAKDEKVVRSLTLHGSPLGQILGTDEEAGGTGRDLQTATGTAEIASYTAAKPDYVKPSRLFSFLIEAFDQEIGPTVIPFADRGSAALSGYLARLANGITMSGLLVNGLEAGDELWKWRLQKAPKAVRAAATIASPLKQVPFETLVLGEMDLEQIASLVSLDSASWEGWNTLRVATIKGCWRHVDGQVQIVVEGPSSDVAEAIWEEVASLVEAESATVHIWGTANEDLMKPVLRLFGRESVYSQVPGCFLP
jgi:hypothetical protein